MGITFHFPLLLILFPMMAAVAMPLMKNTDIARNITLAVQIVLIIMAVWLTFTMFATGTMYFRYQLGYYPAPWGNELRIGMLEAILACAFTAVMMFSLLGTKKDTEKDIPEGKRSLYYCMINLLSASLLALVFTNDLFNAYVFIEISTIAACAIVVSKENGDTLKATIKYLFLSVMGSGLFLMSIAILYSITGHLLMEHIAQSIAYLAATGDYNFPLTVSLLLFIVSMAVKSALFPFHSWLPDAHGSATTASSAILSGLVVKGYVVLLLKLLFRVYGIDTINALDGLPVLFFLGVTGMIAGSVMACFQTKLKRLIAYSSVAQIGYIFMGMGLNTHAGFTAAGFHIIAHSFTKSMLFISAGALIATSGSYLIADLTGAGRKNKIAGAAFLVGALSMAGIPLFSGFVSKFHLAGAAMQGEHSMWITTVMLSVSTFLNSVYYFPVIVKLYSPASGTLKKPAPQFALTFTLASLMLANVALGIYFTAILNALDSGFRWLG